MAFSNDGAKMFVIGTEKLNINEYTLTTPFDVSTATFADVTFDVLNQNPAPTGMAFSNDGAKMFVVGVTGSTIYEYALSSVYPIRVTDGTPPTFVSSGFNTATGVLTITFSEDIDVTPAANVVAARIHVRESGTYTGGITLTAGELGTAADASTISFTLNMSRLETVKGLRAPELTIDPGAVRDTSGNLIASTFDVSTAAHVDSFSVRGRDGSPRDVAFSNDGTKMFVVGSAGADIHEYALSAPFDVTPAAHVSSFNVTEQDTFPTGMAFSNDGAKMFVAGDDGADINEYTLTTPFNVTTATFVDSFDVSGQDGFPTGVAFSNDGAKMFVAGSDKDDIYEYALTTPFNVTTAAFAHSFSVTAQDDRTTRHGVFKRRRQDVRGR